MSDELRAAAERLRHFERCNPSDETMYSGAIAMHDDLELLGWAYLREHPADDDEPVDEEWLRSVGNSGNVASHHGYVCELTNGALTLLVSPSGKSWLRREYTGSSSTIDGPILMHRVDVRNLASALGIELKE